MCVWFFLICYGVWYNYWKYHKKMEMEMEKEQDQYEYWEQDQKSNRKQEQ